MHGCLFFDRRLIFLMLLKVIYSLFTNLGQQFWKGAKKIKAVLLSKFTQYISSKQIRVSSSDESDDFVPSCKKKRKTSVDKSLSSRIRALEKCLSSASETSTAQQEREKLEEENGQLKEALAAQSLATKEAADCYRCHICQQLPELHVQFLIAVVSFWAAFLAFSSGRRQVQGVHTTVLILLTTL